MLKLCKSWFISILGKVDHVSEISCIKSIFRALCKLQAMVLTFCLTFSFYDFTVWEAGTQNTVLQ